MSIIIRPNQHIHKNGAILRFIYIIKIPAIYSRRILINFEHCFTPNKAIFSETGRIYSLISYNLVINIIFNYDLYARNITV